MAGRAEPARREALTGESKATDKRNLGGKREADLAGGPKHPVGPTWTNALTGVDSPTGTLITYLGQIRDEEVIGSNPATPDKCRALTSGDAGQASHLSIGVESLPDNPHKRLVRNQIPRRMACPDWRLVGRYRAISSVAWSNHQGPGDGWVGNPMQTSALSVCTRAPEQTTVRLLYCINDPGLGDNGGAFTVHTDVYWGDAS